MKANIVKYGRETDNNNTMSNYNDESKIGVIERKLSLETNKNTHPKTTMTQNLMVEIGVCFASKEGFWFSLADILE